jgi:hypothetical protein
MHEIAIIILSCDRFEPTWKPCIDHLFNIIPKNKFKIYLLNNLKESNDKRVQDLKVGEDLNWSDSLIKGLKLIKEERVFFIYDDTFITYFNTSEVLEIFKLTIDNKLDSVSFKKNPFDKGIFYNSKLSKFNKKTKYKTALHLNLFRKEVLLSLLKSGENAWQFEKDGNQRSFNVDFYFVKETLINYKHGIVKGKWLPSTKKYLLENGYSFHENDFETFSYFKVFQMNIYRLFFIVGNKLLNLFRFS